MKALVPVALVLVGLGVGVGAGLKLKPDPEPEPEAEAPVAEATVAEATPAEEDVFRPVEFPKPMPPGGVEFVALDKPFVVPVFNAEDVAAMVVLSLSVEVATGHSGPVTAFEPRLRDAFLQVLFRHANSGGFDGSFTTGQKMQDLKSALLGAAQTIVPDQPVTEILITEIVRQDV